MASEKDFYQADYFAAGFYEAGFYRGVGIEHEQVKPCGEVAIAGRYSACVSIDSRYSGKLSIECKDG